MIRPYTDLVVTLEFFSEKGTYALSMDTFTSTFVARCQRFRDRVASNGQYTRPIRAPIVDDGGSGKAREIWK
jgi:hypothetical protein